MNSVNFWCPFLVHFCDFRLLKPISPIFQPISTNSQLNSVNFYSPFATNFNQFQPISTNYPHQFPRVISFRFYANFSAAFYQFQFHFPQFLQPILSFLTTNFPVSSSHFLPPNLVRFGSFYLNVQSVLVDFLTNFQFSSKIATNFPVHFPTNSRPIHQPNSIQILVKWWFQPIFLGPFSHQYFSNFQSIFGQIKPIFRVHPLPPPTPTPSTLFRHFASIFGSIVRALSTNLPPIFP